MRDRLLELEIDPGVGRRAGLEGALRRAVRSGQLRTGDPLPSTRVLARELGLARSTVVAGYEQLTAEGYLDARPGAGTVVGSVGAVPFHEARPATPPDVRIDFVPGEPDRSSFPRRAWLASVRHTLDTSADELFGYGDSLGRHELRNALAAYLARTRAVAADPGRVSVFGGFLSSLTFLAQAFRRCGIDRVGVEDPGMPFQRRALVDAGMTVVPVSVDAEGLSVDALESAHVGAVLVTPAHQYPLGVAMSSGRRAALLDWARRHEAWIVEDDYDGEFRYDRQPIGSLQGLGSDRVVYGGTASKSLAAGLRVAWLVVPPDLMEPVARAKGRHGGVSNLDQAALAHFIESGAMDRHVNLRRRAYRLRQNTLTAALDGNLPGLALDGISAGLHLTAHLGPGDMREDDLVRYAATRGLALWGLGQHWFDNAGSEGIVFGFSRSTDHAFGAAVELLVDVLRDAGVGAGADARADARGRRA